MTEKEEIRILMQDIADAILETVPETQEMEGE